MFFFPSRVITISRHATNTFAYHIWLPFSYPLRYIRWDEESYSLEPWHTPYSISVEKSSTYTHAQQLRLTTRRAIINCSTFGLFPLLRVCFLCHINLPKPFDFDCRNLYPILHDGGEKGHFGMGETRCCSTTASIEI